MPPLDMHCRVKRALSRAEAERGFPFKCTWPFIKKVKIPAHNIQQTIHLQKPNTYTHRERTDTTDTTWEENIQHNKYAKLTKLE